MVAATAVSISIDERAVGADRRFRVGHDFRRLLGILATTSRPAAGSPIRLQPGYQS